jgi:hypothetical protein
MKPTFYDILFYSIFNVMRRQGNPRPEDDRFDGLVGGAIFLTLVPIWIYFDVAIILKHFSPVSILPGKIVLLIIGCAVLIFNFIFFRMKNRYLAIQESIESIDKRRRKKYLWFSWMFVLVLLVIFFLFAYLKFKTW